MKYRIAVDTGGTFTDVVISDTNNNLFLGKASTDLSNSFSGIYKAIENASQSIGSPSSEIIQNTNVLIYGTTRATNAIITGKVAKTAAIFTKNFKDILIYRSGGKKSPFKLDDEIIPPYVPRHLTLEANERTLSEGDIHTELDLNDIEKKLTNLKKTDIESIGVCLIWSISNPLHEIKIGELIKSILPNISYTLSHQLNPVIREYPRASSTVIDASLKPLM